MSDKNIIECKCGRPYNKSYIKSHIRSNEHKRFIEQGKKIIYPKYTECADNKVMCECGKIIGNCRDNMRGHEKSWYHILYMDCPKGGSFTYKLSVYENNGNEQYITVHKK